MSKNPQQESATSAMEAELAKLRAENEQMKKAIVQGVRIKVSQKGAVSLYGFGRFPVTLYAPQWKKVFTLQEKIETFIEDNKADLSFEKAKSEPAPVAVPVTS